MISQKIVVPVLAAIVGGGALLSLGTAAYAQTPSRLYKLEQRFHNKLDQEVQQGKITSAQETAIINEATNLMKSQLNAGSFRAMTPLQKEQAFQKFQNDMKSWAQSQGINPSYIPVGHIKFGQGHKAH